MKAVHAKSAAVVIAFVCGLFSAVDAQIENGLVGYYSFDEGGGPVAYDRSPSRNNGRIVGGATWAKGSYGTALEFDGKDDYVICGTGDNLKIGSAGTVMLWACPKTVRGGFVSLSTGEDWSDQRLVLGINTFGGAEKTTACLAGNGMKQKSGFGSLEPNQWSHIAATFDGRTLSAFRDGVLIGSRPQTVIPDIKGVPLWIGRCRGLGEEYFHGILDEVRIYNRPLTAQEVLDTYKQGAETRNRDLSHLRRFTMQALVCPMHGKLMVTCEFPMMRPLLTPGSTFRIDLCRAENQKPLAQEAISEFSERATLAVMFDIRNVPHGTCLVRARPFTADGAAISDALSKTITWSGRPEELRDVRVLNNLVWELLNVRPTKAGPAPDAYTFTQPYDRWVYVRSTADVKQGGGLRVGVDSGSRDSAWIVHDRGRPATLETMRYLKAGKHALSVAREGRAELRGLVVRSIPALQHAAYGANPKIRPYGPYDWEFLSRDVLPNITTMIGAAGKGREHVAEWKKLGRRWITLAGRPDPGTGDPAERCYNYWAKMDGLYYANMDGIIVDEFSVGGDQPGYDAYRQAVERIYASPKFKGKQFSPYCGGAPFPSLNRSATTSPRCT